MCSLLQALWNCERDFHIDRSNKASINEFVFFYSLRSNFPINRSRGEQYGMSTKGRPIVICNMCIKIKTIYKHIYSIDAVDSFPVLQLTIQRKKMKKIKNDHFSIHEYGI